jgi:hypothetical protein
MDEVHAKDLNLNDTVILDRGHSVYGIPRYLQGYVERVTETQVVIHHSYRPAKKEIARFRKETNRSIQRGCDHTLHHATGAVAENAMQEAYQRKLKRFDWTRLDIFTLSSVADTLYARGYWLYERGYWEQEI